MSDRSGRQPCSESAIGDIALNVVTVTAPYSSRSVHAPSHSRSWVTDAPGNFRQAVGLVRKLYRRIAGFHQFDPLGNMVMQRTGPFGRYRVPACEAKRAASRSFRAARNGRYPSKVVLRASQSPVYPVRALRGGVALLAARLCCLLPHCVVYPRYAGRISCRAVRSRRV